MRALALVYRFAPALLVMAVIYLASDTPGDDLLSVGAGFDFEARKTGHLVGYALLGLAYLHALVPRGSVTPRLAWIAVVLATLYAVSDEVHQVFVPGRGAGARDVMIDAVGATLGVGLRLLRQGRRLGADSVPPS